MAEIIKETSNKVLGRVSEDEPCAVLIIIPVIRVPVFTAGEKTRLTC